MKYITYSDMAATIRRNIWKVPHDVDLIVGIPRSGMIAALMIGELMHKRVAEIGSFLSGHTLGYGGRGSHIQETPIKKVLLVDDTVFNGNAMFLASKYVEPVKDKYIILTACIYAEGRNAKDMVNIYFEDIYDPHETLYLYEWNILHHHEHKTKLFMFDMDGVLCKEPPDERYVMAYEEYLPNAIPMVVPTTIIGAIVTYRMDKYRDVTDDWLKRYGIEYGELCMINDYARKYYSSPATYKADIYRSAEWAQLFIESDPFQAPVIGRLSKKPVYCYDNNIMYTYKL